VIYLNVLVKEDDITFSGFPKPFKYHKIMPENILWRIALSQLPDLIPGFILFTENLRFSKSVERIPHKPAYRVKK